MSAAHNGATDARLIDGEMSDEFKMLGFEPGWPVMELGPFEFGIDLIIEALAASTYWHPKPIPFAYEQRIGDRDELWRLPMTPELVQAVHVPFRVDPDDQPIGCHDEPSWYIRGQLAHGSISERAHLDQMHVLLEPMQTRAERTIDVCTVQLVRYERPDVDQHAPLRWLAPTQPPGQH